jgi:hypothetical protein
LLLYVKIAKYTVAIYIYEELKTISIMHFK